MDAGGAFAVDELTGAATLRLPLATSAPRALAPELALAYRSGGANGPAGRGFSLTLPRVSRYTGAGVPRYDDGDTFALAGQPLVPLPEAPLRFSLGGVSYTATRYAPRTAPSRERIERWVRQSDGDTVWRTVDQTGLESVFGLDPSGRVADPADPGRVFEWLLQAQYDQRGEGIAYGWLAEDGANLPDEPWEAGRDRAAQRYLGSVAYAPQTALTPPPCGIGPVPAVGWHAEMLFDYGQYDTDPANPGPHQPARQWAARPDPFSRYDAGFEVRTHRLLAGVLLFHRFTALGTEPALAHLTRLTYAADPAGCRLARFDSVGCDGAEREPLPPLELEYTPLRLGEGAFAPVAVAGPGRLPGLEDPPRSVLADLSGEGVGDAVHADGESVRRRPAEPAPGAAYGRDEALPEFPLERRLAGDGVRLADLSGDGRPDLLLSAPQRAGAYPGEGEGFGPFAPLTGAATELSGPATLADLSGDGLPDLVALANGGLRRYPGQGATGFGTATQVPAPAGAPATLDGGQEALIAFADLLGGGSQDLVRIADGSVECWPGLGYGALGERVVLGGAPSLGAEFDPRRLRLADVDGSGYTDLVYVDGERALVYLNQSGNGFAAPVELPLPVTVGAPEQVELADLRGTGTPMLVVAEVSPEARQWACPLAGDEHPYLLSSVRNGLGAETSIRYSSSTRYWLRDRAAGTPWATTLPFPVPVVAGVVQRDLIAKSSETSTYRYRHGCWSAPDREYGFALVERRDAETAPPDEPAGGEVPVRRTRTWRLLGALPEPELEAAVRAEWFAGDPEQPLLPGPAIEWGGPPPSDGETVRQAYAALRGLPQREEVYGPEEEAGAVPYRVTQSAHGARLLAPRGDGLFAAFASRLLQTLDCLYEGDATDPVVRHSANLEIDPDGQVLRAVAVSYPRRPGARGALPAQEAATIVCDRFAFVDIETETAFRVGIPGERQADQLSGLPAPATGGRYAYAELAALVAEALAGRNGMSASPLERSRLLYYEADGVTPAPLGKSGPQALLRTELRAALGKPELALFGTALSEAELTALLERGHHEYDAATELWWALGPVDAYLPATGFHRLARSTDPGGAVTVRDYDATTVALLETTRSATATLSTSVVVTAYDYLALAPLTVRDVNGNVTEAALDPLAQTALSSFQGTELGQPLGFEAIAGKQWPRPPSAAALIAAPEKYLQGAAEVVLYDLLAWVGRVTKGDLVPLGLDSAALLAALVEAGYVTPEGAILHAFRALPDAAAMWLPEPFAADAGAIHALLAALPSGQPSHWVKVSARDYPGREPGPPEIAVDYVDGGGRSVQRKQQASGQAKGGWVTSGAVRRNGRGLVRARCEPFFADGWAFTPAARGEELGPATSITYDPLDRPLRIDRPEGFFASFSIGAWSLTQADEVDTVLQSRYWREHSGGEGIGPHQLQALKQAAALAETPVVHQLDPLGSAIACEDLLRGAAGQAAGASATLVTGYGRDALGRQTWSADPRLSASGAAKNFETVYSLTGEVLLTVSADAGERLRLTTAAGQELFVRDRRGTEVETAYDALERPLAVVVREPGVAERTAEAYVYGDQLVGGKPVPPDPAGWNLIGEAYRLFDQAGMRQLSGYSLGGEPQAVVQRYLAQAGAQPDWTPAQAVPSSPLLAAEEWRSARTYDAGGRLTAMTDPVGSSYAWTHNRLGFTEAIAMAVPGGQPVAYLSEVRYNAQGQRTRVALGNGVVTTHSYDPLSFRLTETVSKRADGSALQQLSYAYDPVGNLTYREDAAFAQLFGAAVPAAASALAYDSLYRLVSATGLEPPACTAANERQAGYEGLAVATVGDKLPAGSLVSATRLHAHDAAGNLYWTERAAAGAAWTTETVMSASSNRGVAASLLGLIPAPPGTVPPPRTLPAARIDAFFDGDGNQTAVEQMPALGWDFADRLSTATVALAGGGQGSLLRAHDATDEPLRELQTVPVGNGSRTIDTLRLGDLEVASTSEPGVATATAWRIRVRDGASEVAEALVEDGAATVAYSLADPAGSVALRLDPQGTLLSYEAYTPYGATAFAVLPSAAEAANKLVRYDGHERDRLSGTYDFQRRELAPWLGRWLSPDPTGPVDGLNLFSFAASNPTSNTDVGGRVKLQIDHNTTIDISPEQILKAVEAAAAQLEADARADPMSSSGTERKMPLYEAKRRGDLLRLAFTATVRGDPIAGLAVASYALRFGNLDVTEKVLGKEVGVHGTVIVANQDRPGMGLFGYDEIEPTANEQAEARRLIHLFKVKTVPTGTNVNDAIIPIMAISESDRSAVGGLLSLIELYNVKYGQHTIDQAFKGKNPLSIAAKKGGGAKALKQLTRLLRGIVPLSHQRMTRAQWASLHNSLETFAEALNEHRGPGKGSKFAGMKTADEVSGEITRVLYRRARAAQAETNRRAQRYKKITEARQKALANFGK